MNCSNGTPADNTAQGRVRTEAGRRVPSTEPGYSSFNRSTPSMSFSARAASMMASSAAAPSIPPRKWIDQVLDDRWDTRAVRVVDHLASHLQNLCNQIRLTGPGCRTVGAQLHKNFRASPPWSSTHCAVQRRITVRSGFPLNTPRSAGSAASK